MTSYKKLSIAQQDLAIKSYFPSFQFQRKKGIPTWNGILQPTENSPLYYIRITYANDMVPRVWVTSPKIHIQAPHQYKDKSLCLYYPNDKEAASWSSNQYIAETIIPWTSLWLAFYEIWTITGKWYGSEVEHTTSTESKIFSKSRLL